MRKWNVALAVLALLLAIVVYVPIATRPLELEPDLSLRVVTHDAFARHLQFGRDLVYTYGPWGILYRGFDPRTERIVLAVSALLAIVFASTMFQLTRKSHPAAAVAILIGAAAVIVSSGDDVRFIAFGLLVLLCGFLPPERARDVPLVAALALVALIKFSFLIVALFVIATRRSWEVVAVFFAAFVIFWLGGSISMSYRSSSHGAPRFPPATRARPPSDRESRSRASAPQAWRLRPSSSSGSSFRRSPSSAWRG